MLLFTVRVTDFPNFEIVIVPLASKENTWSDHGSELVGPPGIFHLPGISHVNSPPGVHGDGSILPQ